MQILLVTDIFINSGKHETIRKRHQKDTHGRIDGKRGKSERKRGIPRIAENVDENGRHHQNIHNERTKKEEKDIAHKSDLLSFIEENTHQKTENDLANEDKGIDTREDQRTDKIRNAISRGRPKRSIEDSDDCDREKTDLHAPHSRCRKAEKSCEDDRKRDHHRRGRKSDKRGLSADIFLKFGHKKAPP